MKNNKGLSLVELIVIIAIMSVLIGSGVFGLSLLIGAEAKQAANNFEGQLNDVKTGTMAMADSDLYLFYAASADTKIGIDQPGFYVAKVGSTIQNAAPGSNLLLTIGDPEYSKVGSNKVTIKVYLKDSTTPDYTLDSASTSKCVKIGFSRKDGSLEDVCWGNIAFNADGTISSAPSTSNGILSKIEFTSGLRTYTITFTPSTGKFTLN